MNHLDIIKKRKKKDRVNKSHSLTAMFVSEKGRKYFTLSKIHPMNTMEAWSTALYVFETYSLPKLRKEKEKKFMGCP